MWLFDQSITILTMPETLQPTEDKQEAYQAFIEKYSLNPSNNDAIMNCLFELYDTSRKQTDKIHDELYRIDSVLDKTIGLVLESK